MSRIKIKNFGPIKEGFKENDGWIDIEKVTVFIGNQGSGKSTVAKLISTFMWLEKAMIRGDVKSPIAKENFLELFEFHRLENYFEPMSEIEFIGNTYHLILCETPNREDKIIEAKKVNNKLDKLSKIMYVPAERNFLSSIENINKVSNLIVGSLQIYSIEFRNAQIINKDKPVQLPINNTKVIYDPKVDESYLLFGKRRLKLSEGSSGFHSIVPLFWVTKYLMDFLKQGEKQLLKLLSTDQTVRRSAELQELNNLGLNPKSLRVREKKINQKYICKNLINIVEEPEQNLFPSSQREILHSLLEFNNMNDGNKLIMTTHSPYLINYLSISIQGGYLHSQIEKNGNSKELLQRLNDVVPIKSIVSGNDVVVYQLDEETGTISKLANTEGIPSDKNFLNLSIASGNHLFDTLLEIEQEL